MDSLRSQSYNSIEIILVDDGSTDGSAELCDTYAAADSRIMCLHQKNSGVSSARNMGLEHCTGDYIHFMDSDDYLELNAYEELMRCIETEHCDVAVCEYFVDYPEKSIKHELNSDLYRVCTGEEAAARLFSGFQFAWNKLFSKKLISGNGGSPGISFREDIYRGEDTLFAAEVFLRADSVCYTNLPLYHYVQSEESACRGRFRESQLSILKLYRAYKDLYNKVDMQIPTCFWVFMHDNLISLYYDMWADPASFQEGEKSLKLALKEYYSPANSAANGDISKRLKFFIASFFPDLFCVIHKTIHHL